MDIRGIAQFPGPTPSSDPSFRAGSPGGAISSTAGQRQAIATPDTTDGVKTASEVELPKLPFTRAEQGVDHASKHYYARIVDRNSGRTVAEYPSKALLQLFAVTRQQLGKILKSEA